LCCVCTGSSICDTAANNVYKSQLIETKIEVDNNSIGENHDDDKTQLYLSTVSDKRFAKKKYFNARRKRHVRQKYYSCARCEKRFLWQSSLYRHMNVHKDTYRCTDCGKCCDNSHSFARHRQSHIRKKPDERSTEAGSLVAHSRLHSEEKLYKCPFCVRAFSRSERLDIHMRVHSGGKLYSLRSDKRLSQLGSLQKDRHYVQSKRRPYRCLYCRKLFKTNSELKQHVRIHTGEKPYSCRHCSDCFMWPLQLNRHLQKSHSEGILLFCVIFRKPFICSYFNLYIQL